MSETILHHYPQSLFSEKARAMLNARGVAWRSVIIPMIAPRPETIPLTGGYRRTPILQVGADIYCDTALIAAWIEDTAAGDTFYPAAWRLAAQTLARWADTDLFWAAVTLRFQPQNNGAFFADDAAAQAFAADRAAFSQGSTIRRLPLEESEPRYRVFMAELEAQLADGRPYLFGPAWSIADFSVYHVLWFLHGAGAMAEALAAHPHVEAFLTRMRAFGSARGGPMSGEEALAVAAGGDPAEIDSCSNIVGLEPGTLVDVAPTDYGVMPSRGRLLRCDDRSIVIRREHERTGAVNVHFPRLGFGVQPVAA